MFMGGLGIDFVEEFLEKFLPTITNTPWGAYPGTLLGPHHGPIGAPLFEQSSRNLL